MRLALLLGLLAVTSGWAFVKGQDDEEVTPVMSNERVVFQTEYGDIHFGFWPEVAPVTTAHIFKLARMDCYTSNQFFRVDKGFVAQVSDVIGGRTIKLNEEQQKEASKNVPLEVVKGVKHHAGVVSMARGDPTDSGSSSIFIMLGSAPHLDMGYGAFGPLPDPRLPGPAASASACPPPPGVTSMGRYEDPDSGASSFSILLGSAPHLDMQYTAFGKVTEGMEVLRAFEELPTKREGIFVMPLKRITILATYWYRVDRPEPMLTLPSQKVCDDELAELEMRFTSQAEELQRVRKKCLPA
ncbi:hypothetical protein HYH03_001515 [Edaphochlamys debaryana]|uniref:PPIase cyclophilin-type domain-containing protein n=1 Tax=Edaphochlamys debaryana TaxID=47281 RepID=A0A835YGF4_9CHLO|nr:hypothetical protein HYH03_001515 [Edaphochlamys debaryana]|eukprot:KAG2500753.1 hypothetical protein HYH03_001515 [Edaphochlamys debaryana]